MNAMDDAIPMKGIVAIKIFKNGVIIEDSVEENLIVNGAKNQLARLIGGDVSSRSITHFGVGNGTAVATSDNVTLQNSVWKPVSSVSYPSTGRVQFNFGLSTADANGLSITELGLRCDNGTLFSRKTRKAINKDSDISISGTWTIIF